MPKTFTEDQFRAVIQHTWNVFNGSYLPQGVMNQFIDQQVEDFYTFPLLDKECHCDARSDNECTC